MSEHSNKTIVRHHHMVSFIEKSEDSSSELEQLKQIVADLESERNVTVTGALLL